MVYNLARGKKGRYWFTRCPTKLLEEIFKVNRNIVLVLNNGRPLAIPWAADNIPAIVEAWQLGTQSGNAYCRSFIWNYNPSGKLPMTFLGM
jgi:beta-glucosidase